MHELLVEELHASPIWRQSFASSSEDERRKIISFEECEEALFRMAWCRSQKPRSQGVDQDQGLPTKETEVDIPLNSTLPPVTLRIGFKRLSEPIELAFFDNREPLPERPDDNELPIDQLAHQALSDLPEDLRAICMSRIIITGGGSNIPGIKQRVLDGLQGLVDARGWSKVQGRVVTERQKKVQKPITNAHSATEESKNDKIDLGEHNEGNNDDVSINTTASAADQETDPITLKLLRDEARNQRPAFKGQIRGVETLGAWTGASLSAGLRVKSTVEVEREKFLSHGLLEIMKVGDSGPSSQRLSGGGAGISRSSGTGDRWGSGLGAWA